MFSLCQFTPRQLATTLAGVRSLPLSYPTPFGVEKGPQQALCPPCYKLDHTRSQIGQGESAFAAAQALLRSWQHFDLGWVRIANPEAPIAIGEIIAVEACALGLWSLNLSRILTVIDEQPPSGPHRFGFVYGTTPHHVERGEECFLLEFDPVTGAVHYDLLAISHPAHLLAQLAYPFTRSQQHRFARESHARMAQVVSEAIRS